MGMEEEIFVYSEIKIQRSLVEVRRGEIMPCGNCDATGKTANMFLLFKGGSNTTRECYCEKHIIEHLAEYVKELVIVENVIE